MTPQDKDKLAFYAQYYFSKMLVTRYNPKEFEVWEMLPEIIEDINDYEGKYQEKYILLLKDLKNISDEDAIELGFDSSDSFRIVMKAAGKSLYNRMSLLEIDLLRSRGYALPYLNYSVEQLIELKWIKLI